MKVFNRILDIISRARRFERIEQRLWGEYEKEERLALDEYKKTDSVARDELERARCTLARAQDYCKEREAMLRGEIDNLFELRLKVMREITNMEEKALANLAITYAESQKPWEKYRGASIGARCRYELRKRRIARKYFNMG